MKGPIRDAEAFGVDMTPPPPRVPFWKRMLIAVLIVATVWTVARVVAVAVAKAEHDAACAISMIGG